MSNIIMEEYELMKDSKYRAYMSAVDKALRNFEYTSEWADLISALGKLNKVLLANMKFPVIPRRIKISKRLAQCMHPVLPSGVHLKALETYDIIFKCMGTSRLSHELFIYSAGLFPLLGHSAMIVRPSLLTVYETHFVPLGERLTPALSGFLSGVLPGLEEGSDHFDRTNSLLEKVSDGVGKARFYGCLWECLASNSAIRLPGVGYALQHFNKKLSMEDQLHVMGTSVDMMVVALCACVQDSSVLVQRSTLDLLLAGLPMHNSQLVKGDLAQLLTAALTTILRRDMSLNRRLFAWLLGTEVNSGTSELRRTLSAEGNNYFDLYSRSLLVQAIKKILSQGKAQSQAPDLRPYRLLMSLLDKPDIGPIILDDILHEVFRTLYLSCEGATKEGGRRSPSLVTSSLYKGSQELLKQANLLFSALEPSYVWQFAGTLFDNACKAAAQQDKQVSCASDGPVRPVDSGPPDIIEVCSLTQFLLDMVSLDTYADTPTEHLPGLFLRVLLSLTRHCSYLSAAELAASLQLCRRVLVRVQPGSSAPQEDEEGSHVSYGSEVRENSPEPQNTVVTSDQSLDYTITDSTSSITNNDNKPALVSSESNSKTDKVTLTEDATAAPPVYLDSEGTLDLTDPVSIDSDSSSASLLMDSSQNLADTQDSKSAQSTRADTSLPEEGEWTQKLSDMQSLLEPTSSIISEVSVDSTSIISESSTLPFYETSLESTHEIKDWASLVSGKADSIPIHSPVAPEIKITSSLSGKSEEKSTRQHSVMSECLQQFQELFVRLVSKRVLSPNTDISTALHHVLSMPPRDSTEHRTRELESKLKECLGVADSDKQQYKGSPLRSVRAVANPGPEWPELRETLNQACRLLVELSTFPTLYTTGRTPTADREQLSFGERFPAWLQTLLVLCAGLEGSCSLQLLAAATFLDLLALLRAVPTQREPQNRGVGAVIIIPLLTPVQVTFLERHTAVFQTMARLLWEQLGAPCPANHLQCAQLLLRLHNALPGSDVVEDVIGGSLSVDRDNASSDSQRVAEAFERFTTLWHLSREPSDLQVSQCRALDKSLFKMLDNLRRPAGPLQLQTQGWLVQALLRGDTARVLEPLLLILLAPGSARLSLRHATVSHAGTVLAKHLNEGSEVPASSASRIFAVSSQDGHVVYHVSEAGGVSRGVQARRIHAVTRLASSRPPHCITEAALLRAATSAESEDAQTMSLIVNPMTDVDSDSGRSWSQGEEASGSDSSKENAPEQNFEPGTRVVEGVLQEILDAVVERDSALETSSQTSTAVHPLHTHVLLYAQVYDAQRTLYALGAVRSLLLTSPRVFLCSAASTGLAHGSARGTGLVTLLARHAEAVEGGGSFQGELGAEWTAAARSSMLLEALVSSLLWFARSYYPNLGQARLTSAELAANRQVQLASAELLTLVLAELALLARDGGRGLAQYLADLLQRCRLPRLTLGLLLASVHAARPRQTTCSFTEEVLRFNHEVHGTATSLTSCPHRLPAHVEASQAQLLRLVLALVMLEEQASRGQLKTDSTSDMTPTSPTPPNTHQLRYLPGCPIPQQPIFLAAVMSALKLEHLSHQHQSWTVMLASALPFMGPALAHVVLNVSTQLSANLERLAALFLQGPEGLKSRCCVPAQYASTQLEALATLLHYCLLDSALQQTPLGPASTAGTIQASFPDAQPGQLFSSLMHFFAPQPQQESGVSRPGQTEAIQEARRAVLSSLPRVMTCATSLWNAVRHAAGESRDEGSVLGSPRAIRQQLVQFLSPIALHHASHFLAAVAVVAASAPPEQAEKQRQVLVSLISAIRVLPLDTFVQTVQSVVKQPPPLVGVQQNVEVSLLEVLSCYLQSSVTASQLAESWQALLALLRECVTLPPPTPFLALSLLSSLLHRAPAPSTQTTSKDARSVHDVTAKLVETCAQLAGACLEQTTWLRRNLAVREDASPEPLSTASTPSPSASYTRLDMAASGNSYRHSVQAQTVLAELLAPLLDVAFGSQDKERVVALLTGVLANITPYLRNHSVRNAVSFRACSQLLASVSGYQYTRRAWRREALELLLDSSFFQMEPACLTSWKCIVDNLMAHDTTTFRDLLVKVSVPQSGSLSLFSSKEQELEQRAQLLKRLAFVLFCGEIDQYQKHMHEIQERLADCLRLPQAVPSLQAQVFLCFRVLLIRMSTHHVTSLWPIVISELVQAMLHMEHQLNGGSEQLRAHLRLVSGLDAAWALDTASNGLNSSGQPAWLALQLAACKLLDLMLTLPASRLPQFTMYRWAFVGDFEGRSLQNGDRTSEEEEEEEEEEEPEVTPAVRSPDFVPHVTRLARLLDAQVANGHSMPLMTSSPGQPLLHQTSIHSLHQLQGFFSALAHGTRPTVDSEWESAIEKVLDTDFLEPLPSK